MLKTALQFSHQLLKEIIKEGDQVIDATVGNGHDTAFLAHLVGSNGHVYGFDIQATAIEQTTKLLTEANLHNVTLYQQGHETIEETLPAEIPLKAAIFNLGYLPKSDKSIITKPNTTLAAVKQILPRLVQGGQIILVVYYGHPGGTEEKNAVEEYVTSLPQEEYNVLCYQFINQRNAPPFVFAIEKK